MNMLNRSIHFARFSAALTVLAGSSLCVANAQQTVPAVTAAVPTLNLSVPATSTAAEATFSSSSDENATVIADNHFDFVSAATDNAQPGQRRRYERPRYRGGNTNPDGSNKYDFYAGVGFTQPLGNTIHYLSPSYSFQFGGGRQFSKNIALNAQFDWDNFVFNNSTLANQLNLYNYILTSFGQGGINNLGGSSHVWSFTLDPRYTMNTSGPLGAYLVGGFGFYHKTANFTTPVAGCDPTYLYYYGVCIQVAANQTIDKYTSNAPGVNGGFGLTYKFSRFSNEAFYADARYVYVFNSNRPGITVATVNQNNIGLTNDYPANSHRTSYIPVKFGVRF